VFGIKTVTIFGGTGFIGRYIVKEIAKLGVRVNVLTRHSHESLYLKTAGSVGQVRLINGDIANGEIVERLVKESDVVINAVGILFEKRKDDFYNNHTRFPELLATLCSKYNIKKFIHISALGIDKNTRSKYACSKFQGEEIIKQEFPKAIILRPSIVFGVEDDFFNKFATLAKFSVFLPLIAGGKTKFQPVYVNDIAKAVRRLTVSESSCNGKLYELGGPDVYNFKELLELTLEYSGKKRFLIKIPEFLATIMAWFFERFPRPLITRDQLKILKTNNVTQDGALTFFDLQVQPRTVEEIVPTYLNIHKSTCNYVAPSKEGVTS